MKKNNLINLYKNGSLLVRAPVWGNKFSIGTELDNDIVLKSGVMDSSGITISQKEGGWYWSKIDELENQSGNRLLNNHKLSVGEWEIRISQNESNEKTEDPKNHQIGLEGNSVHMLDLKKKIKILSPLGAPVLIEGESGTGKELTAKALHLFSKNSQGPFLAINSSILRGTMVQDILFGHEKGAFTGANTFHKGIFEQADGGTLFLDEIGELDFTVQSILLRVLENKIISRIGSEKEIQTNFRLLAATNKNIGQMVREGSFRLDLYHRIAIITLKTVPLREKTEDIELLSNLFLKKMADEVGYKRLTNDAIEILCLHRWPGNCRELKNTLYKVAVMSTNSVITGQEIKEELERELHQKSDFEEESDRIWEMLVKKRGNVTAVSKELGIARTTLRNKIERLNLSKSDNLKTSKCL